MSIPVLLPKCLTATQNSAMPKAAEKRFEDAELRSVGQTGRPPIREVGIFRPLAFCQEFRLTHQGRDADISPAYPRPSRPVLAHVDMQKAAVVHSNSTLGELRNLQRGFVHALQTEAWQGDVCRQSRGMLAVRNSADFLIVPWPAASA